MIPEISKLNWSSEKPSFEEVKGVHLLVQYDSDQLGAAEIGNSNQYRLWFDEKFVRFAVIDMTAPEPEIKPYHQLLPEIVETIGSGWEYKYSSEFERYYVCGFASELHAINAWNDFVSKLEGI